MSAQLAFAPLPGAAPVVAHTRRRRITRHHNRNEMGLPVGTRASWAQWPAPGHVLPVPAFWNRAGCRESVAVSRLDRTDVFRARPFLRASDPAADFPRDPGVTSGLVAATKASSSVPPTGPDPGPSRAESPPCWQARGGNLCGLLPVLMLAAAVRPRLLSRAAITAAIHGQKRWASCAGPKVPDQHQSPAASESAECPGLLYCSSSKPRRTKTRDLSVIARTPVVRGEIISE
jgi:hypothetical protein